MQEVKWQCKWSPTLGNLEDNHQNTWGTKEYANDIDPTIFMGIYSLKDFISLWLHKGRKAILWCGSDIPRLLNGYWLDEKGQIRLESEQIAQWINENCENYVENGVEAEALRVLNIESKIVPSFLGNKNNYQIEYKQEERPRIYASVSGNDFSLYNWDVIERIAGETPEVDYFLYGNTKEWITKHPNVFVRGRISKEEMNEEIKSMTAGFRPLDFDGCSEIIVKSVLWGQHPISRIAYPYVDSYKTEEELIKIIKNLKNKTEPNIKARDWFINNLNKYPWNMKN